MPSCMSVFTTLRNSFFGSKGRRQGQKSGTSNHEVNNSTGNSTEAMKLEPHIHVKPVPAQTPMVEQSTVLKPPHEDKKSVTPEPEGEEKLNDVDPMSFVCSSCRNGLFRYDNFRRAILTDSDSEDVGYLVGDDFKSRTAGTLGDSIRVEADTEDMKPRQGEDGIMDMNQEDLDLEPRFGEVKAGGDNAFPSIWEEEGAEGQKAEAVDTNAIVLARENNVDLDIVNGNNNNVYTAPTSDHIQFTYTTTWGLVQSLTEKGCHWCGLLLRIRDGLPDDKFPRGGPDEKVVVCVRMTVNPPKDWTDVTNWTDIYLNDFKAATYYIYSDSGNVASKDIGLGTHFRDDPSYVDYKKAKECLDHCAEHEKCPGIEDMTLPTRVIDCLDPSKPRLYETRRQMKGRYASLSYVWGGDQKHKTTKAGLQTYLTEGLPTGLAQTITDAITVTHGLGLRWLWVDSLCIIQDSDEDKLNELADMAHIYKDSYVTLTTLSSFRADQGFLPDSSPPVKVPYHVKERNNPTETIGTMYMKRHIPRPTRSRGFRHQEVEDHEPLNDRGWCFQESILSPRQLIFSPPSVRFSCRTHQQNITRETEGGNPNEVPREVDLPPLFSSSRPGDEDIGESLTGYWAQLLLQYTSCKITVPSDKLVAFSSVAQVFQEVMKGEYKAGLWRHNLINELLWSKFGEVGTDEETLPRPKIYRAPSWSWASIDSSVIMHQPHMFEKDSTDYEAEIVECEVVPKSDIHPLGEILSARLMLNVKMHPLMNDGTKCRLTERKGVWSGYKFARVYSGGGWIVPDGNCLQSNRQKAMGGYDSGDNVNEVKVWLDSQLDESEKDRDLDFHVIMLRAGRKWGNQQQPGFMMGILALKIEGQEETYKRVAQVGLVHLPEWFDTVQFKTVTLI